MDGLNLGIRARARNLHEPRAITRNWITVKKLKIKGSQLTVPPTFQLRHPSDSRRLHDKSLAFGSRSTSSPSPSTSRRPTPLHSHILARNAFSEIILTCGQICCVASGSPASLSSKKLLITPIGVTLTSKFEQTKLSSRRSSFESCASEITFGVGRVRIAKLDFEDVNEGAGRAKVVRNFEVTLNLEGMHILSKPFHTSSARRPFKHLPRVPRGWPASPRSCFRRVLSISYS